MLTARRILGVLFFIIIAICLGVSVQAQIVSIDEGQIICTRYESFGNTISIFPNVPITFPIRITNNTENVELGVSNGFRIYMDSDRNGVPDPNGSFGPVSASLNDEYPFLGDYFDIFQSKIINNDGLGTDTIGFYGLPGFTGNGLPAGFDGIAYYLHVGPLAEGSRICIDSSFFPPGGSWLWAPSGIKPQWDGPFCYDVELPPCLFPNFFNTPDTFFVNSCGLFEFQFMEVSCFDYDYEVIEGHGSISNDALYSYQFDRDDNGTVQTVRIFASENSECIEHQWEVNVALKVDVDYSTFKLPGDINTDCISDIEDLVFFVDYQFRDGEAPAVFELADCNSDGTVDIEDLVYLVDYQFHDGPEPIVPW